jgi:hypothetical protein
MTAVFIELVAGTNVKRVPDINDFVPARIIRFTHVTLAGIPAHNQVWQ